MFDDRLASKRSDSGAARDPAYPAGWALQSAHPGSGILQRAGGQRSWSIDWNSALEIWTAVEVAALLLVMIGGAALFPEWSSHRTSSFVLGSTAWIATYVALTWYRRSVRPLRAQAPNVRARLADWITATLLMMLASFLLKSGEDFSRLWVVTSFFSGGVAIAVVGSLGRNAVASLAENGLVGERIAIYGCAQGTDRLIDAIETRSGPAARINGLFDERVERAPGAIGGRPVIKDLDSLIAHAKARQIDAVMLNLPWSATARINELVRRLEQVNVDILLAPAAIQTEGLLPCNLVHVGPVPTLSLYRRPITGLQAIGKIVMDRSVAAIALIMLLPLMLVIAAAIKLDSPGPVLFRQRRRGMNNSPFDMLKFRSMHTHAEDKNADRLVTRGDSRITRVGAFLRKTSMDELPQLVNVLLGTMSLVGPRPHAYGAKAADRLYEDVVRRYPARHRVLPGITGLAQVRGYRGNTGREEDILNRVASDLEYIDNWTLGLDVAILARTAVTTLLHPNAY